MRDIHVSPTAIRDAVRELRGVVTDATTAVEGQRAGIEELAMCWGSDAAGVAFGAAYCPGATEALGNVVERPRQLDGFASKMAGAADEHEATETGNAALAAGSTTVEGSR